ncbi:MAG: NUDIX hydrolase [Stellaceae bacterium]
MSDPALDTAEPAALAIGLCAAIVAATGDEPRILVIRTPSGLDALPSGPFEARHRTLEAGLRNWVERQTHQALGYVEQLYTFGDRDRRETDGAGAGRALSMAYLALVHAARPAGTAAASWQSWYRYFPWEDWRAGRPAQIDAIEQRVGNWAAAGGQLREERLRLNFGLGGARWNEERVLERYEMLYEAGLVPERRGDRGEGAPLPERVTGIAMAIDHRRVLATAIARLRGKIKYRPVVFELMPPSFTLSELQRGVEALAGVRLHKQNFRRLVEGQGLVEETGETRSETGGRPARLMRYRREVLVERLAPGVRLPAARRA